MTGAEAARRDALGHAFFWHHVAVMGFIALGWLAPWRGVLVFYLILLPAVALQWQFNRDSCVLNNIESLIRTGQWRDPENREEGAFLLELARGVTGWNISQNGMNAFIYTAMAVFWGLGLGHLVRGS
jgi:hypothetical protein